ncbi:MAG: hypothetical protein IH840_08425 [Candidatus Heimdallarchaeota archaeon]|nr:hypothetical protein [Candidatus Heimdallarchaeota archaeon]
MDGGLIPIEQVPSDFFAEMLDKEKMDIDVTFIPDEEGTLTNLVRDKIREIATGNSELKMDASHFLAIKLAKITKGKISPGLLTFLTSERVVNEKKEYRVNIWKLAVDEVLQFNFNDIETTLKHIKEVYSQSSIFFKGAIFIGKNHPSSFTHGYVSDYQISKKGDVAVYWINKFLQCQFRINSHQGTKILVDQLKNDLKSSNHIKRNMALNTLNVLKYRTGRHTIKEIIDTFYSEELAEETLEKFKPSRIIQQPFEILQSQIKKAIIKRVMKFQIKEHEVILSGLNELFENDISIDLDSEEEYINIKIKGSLKDETYSSR